MTFEVRCKTPVGPFSSPEMLDLKAPPAVHTAQGRIAAWNREHNLNVAEQHVGTCQPIRGKAGPAQYEVHHSSDLCHRTVLCRQLQVSCLPAGSAARDSRQHRRRTNPCKSAQSQASCMPCRASQTASASWRFWTVAGKGSAPETPEHDNL